MADDKVKNRLSSQKHSIEIYLPIDEPLLRFLYGCFDFDPLGLPLPLFSLFKTSILIESDATSKTIESPLDSSDACSNQTTRFFLVTLSLLLSSETTFTFVFFSTFSGCLCTLTSLFGYMFSFSSISIILRKSVSEITFSCAFFPSWICLSSFFFT